MSSLLDKPLDDIVAEKKLAERKKNSQGRTGGNFNQKRFFRRSNQIQNYQNPRRGGFNAKRFNRRDYGEPSRKYIFGDRNPTHIVNRGSFSSPYQKGIRQIRFANSNRKNAFVILRISNLDFCILQDDLHELFSSVGEVSKVWIDFDKTDRSEGTGGCIFKDPRDAERALRLYDGRMIEGMPIKLEIINGGSTRESERIERREAMGMERGGRIGRGGMRWRGERGRNFRGNMPWN